MEKRGDFKGRITFINMFSLLGLSAYAAGKDLNAFTIALEIVALLCLTYSIVLSGRNNDVDRLPVETSELHSDSKRRLIYDIALSYWAGNCVSHSLSQ